MALVTTIEQIMDWIGGRFQHPADVDGIRHLLRPYRLLV
jgi:hypothetical protein